jgi:sugar/nucleoside kinase (ribokinase family)
MSKFDLLVVGELNPDLILSGRDLSVEFGQHETLVEDARLTIGSSAAIFACGAARLGMRVAFAGLVGDDDFGRFMTGALRQHGVDPLGVIVDPAFSTGLTVILNKTGDRAILTYLGAMAALQAGQVPTDLLHSARHLHLTSYFLQTALQPGLPDLFRRARQAGLTISLDTNWDPQERWNGVEDLLGLVDVFLPNAAEARALWAHAAPEAAHTGDEPALGLALNWLAGRVPVLAVKLGAQGAVARRGEEETRCASIPVQVADTVGAGDSFDAGFVYGFTRGWPLGDCLKLAVACGSLSTRSYGGTQAQPTLDEARAALLAAGFAHAGRTPLDDNN